MLSLAATATPITAPAAQAFKLRSSSNDMVSSSTGKTSTCPCQ